MSSRKAAPARKPAQKVVRAVKRAAAPAGASGGDVSAQALLLAKEIERRAGDGDALSLEALQALTQAVCRTYAAQIEIDNQILPLKPQSVAPTDVMVMSSGLLRSANLAVFELGMWQSWTGR
jgi:hypothetical protein